MRYTSTSAAFAAILSTSIASNILARSVSGSKVVSVDFVKERRALLKDEPIPLPHRKKRDTVTAQLDNAYLLYYADVNVGSPGQKLRLQIDTGSSDVWVESQSSEFCSDLSNPCTEGTFDSGSSSTFKTISKNAFHIGYADGTEASGDYFQDNFSIGNVTVQGLQMGIAYQTNITAGIMGIGFTADEAAKTLYPNLIDQMVTQNIINSKAYSLWLNDQESNTGSILFGGIDTAKYEGNLIGLPIQQEQGQSTPSEFLVVLSSLSVSQNGAAPQSLTQNSFRLGVILDSGSSLMLLPDEAVSSLAESFGGGYNRELESYLVPCSLMNDQKSYISFGFGGQGGPVIRVAGEELALYVTDTENNVFTDNNGDPICQFGIQSQPGADGDIYLFGDTFLRSAYVTYDLDGGMIYMAQTVFNTTESNVLEIQASTEDRSGVPDVSGVASGVSIRPTATGTDIPREGTSRPQGSSTSSPNKPNTAASTGIEKGTLLSVVLTTMGILIGAFIA